MVNHVVAHMARWKCSHFDFDCFIIIFFFFLILIIATCKHKQWMMDYEIHTYLPSSTHIIYGMIGLWIMDYGLWIMDYRLWFLPISKLFLSVP